MSRQKKHPKRPGKQKSAVGQGKRGGKRKGMCLEDRPILEPNAAGIDIGAREIYVAVPPDRDEHPVRVFSTFTERFAQDGAVVGQLRDHHGRHGIHGSVLDSASRRAGATRSEALFSRRSWNEERAGAAHGLA